jgi:hypothetical protein
MSVTLPAGEPDAGPWRRVDLSVLLSEVIAAAGQPTGRPRIVAIDGRGASGKSTLARRLHQHAGSSAVVHTDDLAWHEPLFGWGHLLADHVLRPLHAGRALAYRPSHWVQRGREGSIDVPAGRDLVIIEGTGASQREHAALIDVTVWVQADFAEAERRGIARDIAEGANGDPGQSVAFWHAWMAEELVFFDRQRPWERARVVVNGTPLDALGSDEVELAPGRGGAR